MCAEINKHDRREMSFGRFLDHIQKGYKAGLRYCFVLGSGASRKSGIRTGIELIQDWRKELLPKGRAMLQEIMVSVGIDPKRYDYFFGGDYKVKSSDYSNFFDMRFEGVPAAAYKALQDLMMNAKASFGYYALAVLLCETQNKIVITTNFDTLTEDTLFLYCSEHPLVVGHESLAPYMEATENQARPIVAKVHRDLMLEPLNREEELTKLEDSWRKPLTSVLTRHIPIVIGYGGGDQTLMGLLSEIDLKGIYWCNYEGEPDESVQELLTEPEKTGRYLVELKQAGFDKVMYQLVKHMLPDFDFDKIAEAITSAATKRVDIFSKQLNKYAEEAKSEKNATTPGLPREEGAGGQGAESAQLSEHQPKPDADVPQNLKELSVATLRLMDSDAFNAGEYEKSLAICEELLSRQPDNAEYLNSRGVTLHAMGRYEEALVDQTRAVTMDPKAARFWASRGTTLYDLGRYAEALKDLTKAVRRRPENAGYRKLRGVTFRAMGRYEEALHDLNNAVELEPENAGYWKSRGVTLHGMERYEEALADKTKAVEMEPKNAKYWDSRSATYFAMGRYQEALRDSDKAVELEPDNAKYWDSRSRICHKMGRDIEASRDSNKAVEWELKSENADFSYLRSITLYNAGCYQEALQNIEAALVLDSENKVYQEWRARILKAMDK